jgi:dodecin
MVERVYRLTEVVGVSSSSIEDAIQAALARARQTLRHVRWFEVDKITGFAREEDQTEYQVSLKIGFELEEE